jgi:hypothetical protein
MIVSGALVISSMYESKVVQKLLFAGLKTSPSARSSSAGWNELKTSHESRIFFFAFFVGANYTENKKT